MFFETSVKTRKGVDEVFEAVVDKVQLSLCMLLFPPFE
jgi:GTPase SAR1 family protein